jgi:4-amino-4-deoxy-L-arabinose transferase-like glycosyltransferase
MLLRSLRDRVNLALGRLLDALGDPLRRDRAALVVLIAYCAVWALYGAIAKGSQDIHFDMGEMIAWSREVGFGTLKHPPLAAWLVAAWFSVFPLADWAYYLFAMVLATVALWIAWVASAPYLAGDKRAIGLALLTLVPFFNFHALKYNANTVMIPLWAATAWLFLRSFETRGVVFAALAGLAAAAAVLGKYWAVFLLVGLGIAALSDPRRGAYFRSAAPWVTIAVGAAALVPHAVWLFANDFGPFGYATGSHPGTAMQAVRSAFAYPVGALAYVALPVALAVIVARPSRLAIADTLWPQSPERRLAWFAFVLPLVTPAFAAVATKSVIVSLWAIGSMTLLPVVLLSSPKIALPRAAAVRILALAIAFPLVAVAVSPVIAIVIHRQGVPNMATHYRMVADAVSATWRETTDQPLRVIGSSDDLVYGTVMYFPQHPSAFDIVTPRLTFWVDEARIARDGIALYCGAGDERCMRALEARAAGGGVAKRVEVEVSRAYFGAVDPPDRVVIVAIPPRR